MGLPRASGSKKRRWSADGDEEDDGSASPSKAVCTSPPYALCAEDVLPPHPQSLAPLQSRCPPSSGTETIMEMTLTTSSSFDESEITRLPNEDNEEDTLVVSDTEEDEDALNDGDEDEGNFIDDEEDKDSGFIDGNSIDNSSDDDCDTKGDSSFLSSSSTSSQNSNNTPLSTELSVSLSSKSVEDPVVETDFQVSLAKVLPSSSSQLPTVCTTSISTSSCSPVTSNCNSSINHSSITNVSTIDDIKSSISLPGDSGFTIVTAAQTNAVVTTNTYQGSVSSPSYDPHNTYQSAFVSELYQSRSCTPPWSCTFYDGSQPTTTNKYMEITPNRSGIGAAAPPPPAAAAAAAVVGGGGQGQQSIQCDENGKSYLELGSASPFTNSYSNECGNFTTSPSTYNGNSYSQTFNGGAPGFSSGNGYFNNRQNFCPSSPYGYQTSESYGGNNYEESGGSYGYVNGCYPHNGNRIVGAPNRIQPQRCSSCDPTRTSPRPACYSQQRLSVLNLSMFKLNRFSRFPEPSLHRSVLICNTLRHIEREMEAEGLNMGAIIAHSHSYGTHGPHPGMPPPTGAGCPPDTLPSMPSTNTPGEGPLPSIHSSLIGPPLHPLSHPATPSPSTALYSCESPSGYHVSSYLHDSRDSPLPFDSSRENTPLRPFTPSIPGERQTILSPSEPIIASPQEEDSESLPSQRLCEDRAEGGGINWCSVLSLSSQTDLDSLNNNECNEWNNEGETSPATLTTLTSRTSSSLLSAPPGCSTPLHYSTETEDESSTPNWKLPSLSADDVLKSFPEPPRRPEEDLDSIIKVLVGS
ncbi:hypothetical protein Anas_03973 [Armadillidium nasatum]|uniref:SERTA domain-containing protein n=1 Tax=Armadillidium nasatum TaxID=96803 RepID=A0A5N5TIQ7_9CRUS|nr:hypothetical protein Anas_03973 [Armadillidium nasatum]